MARRSHRGQDDVQDCHRPATPHGDAVSVAVKALAAGGTARAVRALDALPDASSLHRQPPSARPWRRPDDGMTAARRQEPLQDLHVPRREDVTLSAEVLSDIPDDKGPTIPPVRRDELPVLGAIFSPQPSVATKVPTPNIDLLWLRPLMRGANKAALQDSAHRHATKTLHSPAFETVLAEDPTQYQRHQFTGKLCTSPRSALLLLRTGVDAYDLLRRPPRFYVEHGEQPSAETLLARQARAEERRCSLLRRLRDAYDATVAALPLQETVEAIVERPRCEAAEAARRAALEERQIAFVQQRSKKLIDLAIQRQSVNAERAIELEALMARKKARKAAASAKKVEDMQRRHEEMRRLKEATDAEARRSRDLLLAKVTAADLRAEATIQAVRRRRDESTTKQRQGNAARSDRCQESQRSLASAKRVAAEERDTQRQQDLAARQMRLEAQREKKAEVRAAQRRHGDAVKRRADAMSEARTLTAQRRVFEEDERLVEFTLLRDEARRIRNDAFHCREDAATVAVAEARKVADDRAAAVLRRGVEVEACLARRAQAQQVNLTAKVEAHADRLRQKREAVRMTQAQQAFAKLCDVVAIQRREAELEESRAQRDGNARHAREVRQALHVKHEHLRSAALSATEVHERRAAAVLYEISHPRDRLPRLAGQRPVSDQGRVRALDLPPLRSATSMD